MPAETAFYSLFTVRIPPTPPQKKPEAAMVSGFLLPSKDRLYP
nr:MAG TPA_asm: hypothetical protein [Caudoviricetes sp.]